MWQRTTTALQEPQLSHPHSGRWGTKPGTSEVPRPSHLHTPLARPMLAMSSHGQELEPLDVNGCPRILGPVARVMTSQTLLLMGLCPYYRFKAVRREEVLREWGSLPFPGPSSFVPDDPAPVVGPNCWLRERQQPLGTRSWEICSSQVP